jgi:hypothetical protein
LSLHQLHVAFPTLSINSTLEALLLPTATEWQGTNRNVTMFSPRTTRVWHFQSIVTTLRCVAVLDSPISLREIADACYNLSLFTCFCLFCLQDRSTFFEELILVLKATFSCNSTCHFAESFETLYVSHCIAHSPVCVILCVHLSDARHWSR